MNAILVAIIIGRVTASGPPNNTRRLDKIRRPRQRKLYEKLVSAMDAAGGQKAALQSHEMQRGGGTQKSHQAQADRQGIDTWCMLSSFRI